MFDLPGNEIIKDDVTYSLIRAWVIATMKSYDSMNPQGKRDTKKDLVEFIVRSRIHPLKACELIEEFNLNDI